jgi:hypothetical protein
VSTIADLVADTRQRLSSSLTDELNTLASDYTPGDSTVTLSFDPRALGPGMAMSCGENVWYVVAVNTAAKQATVIDNIDGSPAVAKTAGEIVRLNPRVTDWAIFTQIRDQIAHMASPAAGLGIIDWWIDVANYDTNAYVPPTGIVPDRIIAAWGKYGDQWFRIKRFAWEIGAVHVYDEYPYTAYTFVYKDSFVLPTALTDDPMVTCGLSSTMLDIPVLGAAGMLLLSQESKRAQTSAQGDTRRPTEVMPGSNMGIGREFLRMRDQRIQDEYGRAQNIQPTAMGA